MLVVYLKSQKIRERRGKRSKQIGCQKYFLFVSLLSKRMSDLFEERGGFNFDLQARNAALEQRGYHAKKAMKTGTTIVGLICFKENAVVLAADSRATSGNIVANKDCIKIHYIAPNIYCCGAGTAADTDYATLLVQEKLELLRLSKIYLFPIHYF